MTQITEEKISTVYQYKCYMIKFIIANPENDKKIIRPIIAFSTVKKIIF